MIKFMVMFKIPDDVEKFENAYNDFLALAERMPNRKRRQVVVMLGSPMGEPPYYRVLELYFENQADFESSMMSPEGQEAGSELRRFTDGIDVAFAEVYEDE